MTAGGDTSKVLLIGYGTLLFPPSVEHTIGRAPQHARVALPVVVHGFRRLFNLRPDHYEASTVWNRPGVENAGMNVERATDASFNGLAFTVTSEELDRLDRREYAYDRVTVDAHDFESGELVGPGHVYSSPPDASRIERDPDRLLPLWRDVVWARAGAYEVGHRFGEAFDRTTYLADGRTLVADRYRGLLSPGRAPRPEELRPEAWRTARSPT